MAFKPGLRLLVETDFIFGLRSTDPLHTHIKCVLEKCRRGEISLAVLSSSVVEFRSVLYSSGLKPSAVEEACIIALSILAKYGVREYEPLTLEDILIAERLRQKHGCLGFFDSLHAAASKRTGKPLLSSDEVYRQTGIPYLHLKEFQT